MSAENSLNKSQTAALSVWNWDAASDRENHNRNLKMICSSLLPWRWLIALIWCWWWYLLHFLQLWCCSNSDSAAVWGADCWCEATADAGDDYYSYDSWFNSGVDWDNSVRWLFQVYFIGDNNMQTDGKKVFAPSAAAVEKGPSSEQFAIRRILSITALALA